MHDRLKEIKGEFKELAKERKTRKVEPRKGATEEKLLEQVSKMDERIATAKVQMGDRDKLKDVALGTSKINYIVSCAKRSDEKLTFRILVLRSLGLDGTRSPSRSSSPRLCECSRLGLADWTDARNSPGRRRKPMRTGYFNPLFRFQSTR